MDHEAAFPVIPPSVLSAKQRLFFFYYYYYSSTGQPTTNRLFWTNPFSLFHLCTESLSSFKAKLNKHFVFTECTSPALSATSQI